MSGHDTYADRMVLTGTDVVAAVALAGSLLLVTAGATHLRAAQGGTRDARPTLRSSFVVSP